MIRRLLTIMFAGLAGVFLAVLGQSAASAAGGTISGTVTDEQSGDPIPGVTVYVYTDTYMNAGYAYTDANGHFSTSSLPAGNYKIQYNAPYQSAYLGEWYDDETSFGSADPITIADGNQTADAELAVGAKITGRMTAEGTGDPLSGASVTVYSADQQNSLAYGYTDQNGNYTTSALPAGEYKVLFNAPYQTAYLSEWYDDKASHGDADPIQLTGSDFTADASLAKDRCNRPRPSRRQWHLRPTTPSR